VIASIVTLADRPDLIDAVRSLPNTWPEFMLQGPIGNVFFGRLFDTFAAAQLVALDADGAIAGKLHSVPFAWRGDDDDLPDRGWDAILERAFADHGRAARPTAVSLIEARLVAGQRGRGLSYALIEAARRNVLRLGLSDLFGPVRPTGKADEPDTPTAEYAARTRDDGLPVDPWLRVHVRLGARIVKVCPVSMVVPGTLADWRSWTGLPFDRSGPCHVPEALVPVDVCVEHDHAVYVEPNVWVHHRIPGDPLPAAAAPTRGRYTDQRPAPG